MNNIKNIPKNIYLNIDLDGDDSEVEFKDLSGITWCVDKINQTDLKFQLNQTDNRLFTKEDMIAFATYASEIKGVNERRNYLIDNFDVWALIRK